MRGRRGALVGVAGILGIAATALVLTGRVGPGRHGGAARVPRSEVRLDARTPLADLVPLLRDSDPNALGILADRVAPRGEGLRPAVTDAESKVWQGLLGALRTGYPRFAGDARSKALVASTRILDRYAIDPAPADWASSLAPVHDLLLSGMADPDSSVKATALAEVGRLWVWIPGRTPDRTVEDGLAEWKGSLHAPVLRCLADRSPTVRAAAVACLGYLPIDTHAAPAIAYLEDRTTGAAMVRQQVMISFARRRSLLSDEALLKRLNDPEPGVADLSKSILKARGLTHEQISLGQMIYHPKPELRASVIPLLRDRTDIDPVVWLLELSRDAEPSVRSAAVDALASRLSPEVRRRLSEMARRDESPIVRQAASKIVPPTEVPNKTAALPPLPGSAGLKPTAN